MTDNPCEVAIVKTIHLMPKLYSQYLKEIMGTQTKKKHPLCGILQVHPSDGFSLHASSRRVTGRKTPRNTLISSGNSKGWLTRYRGTKKTRPCNTTATQLPVATLMDALSLRTVHHCAEEGSAASQHSICSDDEPT